MTNVKGLVKQNTKVPTRSISVSLVKYVQDKLTQFLFVIVFVLHTSKQFKFGEIPLNYAMMTFCFIFIPRLPYRNYRNVSLNNNYCLLILIINKEKHHVANKWHKETHS